MVAVAVTASSLAPIFVLGRWVLWLCYASVLCVLVAVAVTGAPRPRAWLPAGSQRSFVWIVPVLIVLNGVTPVLGLKTRTAWQMYSNIRLEPDASNHVLFGRSLDVMGAFRDPVSVVAAESSLRDVAGTDNVALDRISTPAELVPPRPPAAAGERHGRPAWTIRPRTSSLTSRAGDDLPSAGPSGGGPLRWYLHTRCSRLNDEHGRHPGDVGRRKVTTSYGSGYPRR